MNAPSAALLPIEIWHCIFAHLDEKDLKNVKLVSTLFNAIVNSPSFLFYSWHKKKLPITWKQPWVKRYAEEKKDWREVHYILNGEKFPLHEFSKEQNYASIGTVAIEGKTLAIAGTKGIQIWDLTIGKCLRSFGETLKDRSKILIALEHNLLVSICASKEAKIWNIHTGESRGTLSGHTQDILALHLYQGEVVTGSVDKTVKLWNLFSGKLLRNFEGHESSILSVSMMGNKIASASANGQVKVWDKETGQCLYEIARSCKINSISIQNNYIVMGGEDKKVVLWNLTTEKGRTIQEHTAEVVQVIFQNYLIVSVDNYYTQTDAQGNRTIDKSESRPYNVRIWNLKTKKCLQTYTSTNQSRIQRQQPKVTLQGGVLVTIHDELGTSPQATVCVHLLDWDQDCLIHKKESSFSFFSSCFKWMMPILPIGQ